MQDQLDRGAHFIMSPRCYLVECCSFYQIIWHVWCRGFATWQDEDFIGRVTWLLQISPHACMTWQHKNYPLMTHGAWTCMHACCPQLHQQACMCEVHVSVLFVASAARLQEHQDGVMLLASQ